MQVAILKSNGSIDKRIERILLDHKIKGDFVEKITRSTVHQYDFIVFSQYCNIPNLPKLIEQIVLEKMASVIYITKSLNIGQYYHVMNDMKFHFIQENNLDFELSYTLNTVKKFLTMIQNLEHDNQVLKEEILLMKLTNKAKRELIKKGLSEEESHQFIQRKSMDMRISKKKLVNLIIQNKIDI